VTTHSLSDFVDY